MILSKFHLKGFKLPLDQVCTEYSISYDYDKLVIFILQNIYCINKLFHTLFIWIEYWPFISINDFWSSVCTNPFCILRRHLLTLECWTPKFIWAHARGELLHGYIYSTYTSNCNTLLYLQVYNNLYAFLGQPQSFTISVRPANNFPADFYFLIDKSFSMNDDLQNLRNLSSQLGIYTYVFVHVMCFCQTL